MSKKPTKKSAKKESSPVYFYSYETTSPEEAPSKYLGWLKDYRLIAIASLASTFLLLFIFSGSNKTTPTTDREMASTSVMIVRPDHKSGGTGVIIKSTPSRSFVLTNSHVCGVVENGGVVITDAGQEHAVVNYVKSKDHDLCMIEVAADLYINTKIASKAPEYYDSAAISGHPALLPTVVTRGHFSGLRIIQVLTGIKPCDSEDFKANPLQCLFFGGIPLIKSYEAQVVTATIQGGSSGSAVYNDKGEITGLVFAGSGEIGYAFIVPYGSVYGFVNREYPLSSVDKPNDMISLGTKSESSIKLGALEKRALVHKCQTDPLSYKEDKIANVCSILTSDMVFNGRDAK